MKTGAPVRISELPVFDLPVIDDEKLLDSVKNGLDDVVNIKPNYRVRKIEYDDLHGCVTRKVPFGQ